MAYPRQNNYLPFLYAGGTFSPLKTWEGEPPLEVCELPPVERMHIYIYAYTCVYARISARMRVYMLYTLGHSSSSRRALPRPHETEVGFSLYRYSTMKQTGERECVRTRTLRRHKRARTRERERERSIRDGKNIWGWLKSRYEGRR